MIGRTNAAGGGVGGGLDFKVKSYETLPSVGTDNEIAVITNTPMTGWVMQAEQPTASDGLVWIEVSTTSEVPFYADKKELIRLYPASVKQYVNGAWASKEAHIYQGEWKQFWQEMLQLYWDGKESAETGTWNVSNGSKESTYIHMRLAGQTEGRIYPTNKVNVGSSKTISAEVSSPADNLLTFTVELNLREATGANASSKATKSDTLAKGETKILSIDISNMSGEYYPVVTTKTVGGSGFDLHKVWME